MQYNNIMYKGGDSPSVLALVFSFDSEFIRILIF